MIPTVKFDSYDSSTNFGMILYDYTIPPAKKKTYFISVPGRNGDLDISDYLGEAYENREISMTFYKKVHINNLNTFQSNIEQALNGKTMKVKFSNDSDFYWEGRISVSEITKVSIQWVKITVKCNASPKKINYTTGEEVL